MKTYRHPETGHKAVINDDDAAGAAALEGAGYVEWGAADIKQRLSERDKLSEENKAKLKAAQEEVAKRFPGPYAEPDESLIPKPLNPNAKVTTDADDPSSDSGQAIASVTVETKQPSGATDVTTIPPTEPRAPAVPKKP